MADMRSDEASPIEGLCAFLDSSPSPFHVVSTVSERLTDAGFREVQPTEPWDRAVPAGFVSRGGSLIGWRVGSSAMPTSEFRLVGAHTDSPNLRVAPKPDLDRYGWQQLHVEPYGGILRNSWLDRDLGLAGQVVDADGECALLNIDQPIARIPQLAIHLDRGVNDKLVLNPQEHLRPVWATSKVGNFEKWLAQETGLRRPVAWELGFYAVEPAAVLGADRSMLASGRIDNQVSCWAATEALIASKPIDHIAVIVLNDHEEVGSVSATGADGPWLEQVLERLCLSLEWSRSEMLDALPRSLMVSADSAHALHPNYPDRHEGRHAPLLNHGPVVKTNVNQRYATSATSAAQFVAACRAVGVEHQVFASKNTMPCGSTIGPISAAKIGIDVVDVGIPQLSMHSARELCGTADPPALAAVLAHVLSASGT